MIWISKVHAELSGMWKIVKKENDRDYCLQLPEKKKNVTLDLILLEKWSLLRIGQRKKGQNMYLLSTYYVLSIGRGNFYYCR